MEIFNQFGINPLLLLAQVVNFAVLLFILKRFLYKPILKVLEERKKRIEESLKNAEEIEKRLVETAEREEEILAKSAREGEKIIRQAQESVTQIIEDGKIKAQQIIDHAVEESRKTAQTERARMEMQIKENLSEIVALALEKVIGKTLTKGQQKEIIEREVKNLS